MKKVRITVLSCACMIALSGCTASSENDVSAGLSTEPASDVVEALMPPNVKDGVTEPGEYEICVTFEWDPISGADEYEIYEESKYRDEDEYHEPVAGLISHTPQTFYVTGAQDDFDFRIKVRAYRGEGENRVYGEWSEYAYGSTYDKTDVSDADNETTASDPETEADELFAKAIAGEIIVNATYEDGTDASFYIPDLPNDPDDYECYGIGDRADLDNDGVKELIINGPYGGKYLDARNGKVYQLAEGEGTAGQLYHADYDGKTYICHVDNSHGGREIFLMDQYNGYGEIVHSTSLTAEYWDYIEFNADAAECHFGDEEISVEKYLELRNEIFGY